MEECTDSEVQALLSMYVKVIIQHDFGLSKQKRHLPCFSISISTFLLAVRMQTEKALEGT